MTSTKTPTSPKRALSPALARTLAAVIREPHPTVRSVCRATGLSSTNTAHVLLKKLRELGLVDWVDGKAGTLRATVIVLPVPRPEE